MKALFFVLLVAVSTTAFASDAPGLTVISFKGSETFKVIYKGAATGKVRLNIIDSQGRTIHTQTVSNVDGFILPVNFKGLQAGNYTIEVVDNAGKYQEEITYTPSFEIKSIHVSKILNEDGKYLLAVANAQNEPINVRIYDAGQKLVYDESKTLDGDFAQVFKMENTGSRYTFEVSDAVGNKKYFSF